MHLLHEGLDGVGICCQYESKIDSQARSKRREMAVCEAPNRSMISNVTVEGVELKRRIGIEVPDQSERQIVLNSSADILVGQIEVGVPQRYLPGPPA